MRRALVHGALLVVTLIIAFFTWTGEDSARADEDSVVVWDHDVSQLAGVSYRSAHRTVEMERRGAGAEEYLWATQTDSVRAPAPDTTARPTTQVTEYPVGEAGENMLEELARLRIARDLGEASDEKRVTYGISDTMPVVTVRLRNGAEHVLAVGKEILGGGNRYVHDVERNRIYVLPIGLVRPLEVGGEMLRLMKYQDFEPDDVASVTVRAGTVERTMRRTSQGAPPQPVWTAPGADRPDPAFGNFMEQVDRLFASRFVSDLSPDTLQPVMRVDYLDERGAAIGFVELFRTPSPQGTSTYYMRTGRTIVLGEVYAPIAERVAQDVEQMKTRG
jgi:hypothetical protein